MSNKLLRALSYFVCVGAMAITLSAPAAAATGPITAQEDAANRVNIAGRQRMLSQRMAKASCYIAINLKVDRHLEVLEAAKNDFASALYGLRYGNDSLRLLTPDRSVAEEAFAPVAELWDPFHGAVAKLLEDQGAQDAINFVYANNDNLLRLSNNAVTIMSETYGGASISAQVANTINVAGRQRMLSQRMAKGFCEVQRNPASPAAQEEFVEALDLFRLSHVALLTGSEAQNIIAPPNTEVRLQLVLVDEAWRMIRQDLELAAAGVPPSLDAVDRVGRWTETLLIEMNRAVGLYGEAIETGS